MKRKIFAIFLSLALIFSAVIPVCAIRCGYSRVYRPAAPESASFRTLCSILLNLTSGDPCVPERKPQEAPPAPSENLPEPAAQTEPVVKEPVSSSPAQQILALVNEQRAAYGLNALSLDDSLSAGAQTKAQDMRQNSYFSHQSPLYGSPFDMMRSFGISYRYAGENIAMGYDSPEAVVSAWMQSEGHRANILSPDFTQLGVGFVSDGGYWTQWFIG